MFTQTKRIRNKKYNYDILAGQLQKMCLQREHLRIVVAAL